MKNLLFALVTTTASCVLYGQEQIVNIATVPEAVTVYLDGAEITSTSTLNIKAGRNRIVIRNLPSSLEDESLNITTDDNLSILSITTTQVPRMADETAATKQLRDSIARLQDEINYTNQEIEAFTNEKTVLSHNESIGGSQTGIAVAELAKAADFFRDRIIKINRSIYLLQKKSTAQNKKLVAMQSLIREGEGDEGSMATQVVIVAEAVKPQTTSLVLKYIVTEAAWTATYDIAVKDVNMPVTVRYKAQVFNNTGVPWKDAKLTFSTGNPTLSATKPQLTPWTLNYTSRGNEGYYDKFKQNSSGAGEKEAKEEIGVTELSASFPMTKPFSVPSDNQLYTVEIFATTLPAIYEYLVIPKVDPSAFLIAKLTGWEKLNLIDGDANIYLGNSYVGVSNINTRLIADTLGVSLGRDNSIVVTRAKLEDLGSNKFIGTKRSESFKYELLVKNNRRAPINVKLIDQIPVSQETDITVEVEDVSGAEVDKPSGRLQWIHAINPGETVKHNIAFTVKFPKNKDVIIRQQRVISTPRYRK